MPDDNRFAGLSDAMDEDDGESVPPEAEAEDQDGSASGDDSATAESTEESESAEPRDQPAFSFEETTPKSIYVREETLTVLEDTEFDVEAILRQEHDVRNVTGREFHDAAVRVLADHADEVAERVLADRTGD